MPLKPPEKLTEPGISASLNASTNLAAMSGAVSSIACQTTSPSCNPLDRFSGNPGKTLARTQEVGCKSPPYWWYLVQADAHNYPIVPLLSAVLLAL
jgi:hypothetical protein